MKNRYYLMNILLVSAFLFGSCSTKEIDVPIDESIIINNEAIEIYQQVPLDQTIIIHDTVITKRDFKLHTPPDKDPDLSKLKNDKDADLKGKPLRFVAIGGSLTAGVRDGGYFNEGMLTSYPNLIARQMKLKEFKQPLFADNEYNGYGRKVPTKSNPTGGPVPKFALVKNNLATTSRKGEELKLSKYEKEVDNYGLPYITRSGLTGREQANIKIKFKAFEDRIGTGNNVLQKLSKNKFDFYILEIGIDDILEYIFTGGDSRVFDLWFGDMSDRPYEGSEDSSPLRLTRELSGKQNNKGFITTIPDVLEFPYFKLTNATVANKYVEGFLYGWKTKFKENLWILHFPDDLLLPTSTIDSVLSSKVSKPLKQGYDARNPILSKNVLLQSEVQSIQGIIKNFNDEYQNLAKKFNLGIVDLNTLYKKINSGTYVEDGVRIDPSYPNGNFYSADGINPTPLGQAVIANEYLRTINSYFKSDIPLIHVSEYSNLK